MGNYSVEVRKLGLCLLDLICEGLGLETGFFDGELSQVQLMAANYYPPCPEPKQVHGLQVLKDDQWLAVEPVPMMHLWSINGNLSSVDHRVVTDSKVSRTTVASFIHPSSTCHIEPAKALVKDSCPLHPAFIYKDFISTYIQDTLERVPPLDRYKLQP
ncbi:hypothetical protein FF1_035709 [Malus domestica]|uniref:Isopenicillin N synthase-like Fe(2+) 2OG dioxygenase domain-containing protein n=1 Tax=Malus domestica TaxID=3750 RepID=A0A498JSW0_MALDO|nr:hypothetical protein DVH24_010620 [Malus domestica]